MTEIYGIVGYGIVGNATHQSLFPNHTPKIHDIKLQTSLDILETCDVVFFCIPTDSDADIENLVRSICDLKKIANKAEIVVRSTVPIGTCNYIQDTISENITYLPEFLRDRHWQEDCLRRPLIIGNDDLRVPVFLREEQFKICKLKEAEILKMFSNTLAATKITFANHFYELCQKTNSSYDLIYELYHETIHDQSYLEAGPGLRGFGGKCLTKDLDFLIDTLKKLNLEETFFTSTQKDNQLWPTTVRKS